MGVGRGLLVRQEVTLKENRKRSSLLRGCGRMRACYLGVTAFSNAVTLNEEPMSSRRCQ